MTSPLSRRDLARAAILAMVTVGLWLFVGGLWHASAWQSPPQYRIDALETLARIELARDRGAAIFTDTTVERLGAPFAADWSGYPMPDMPVFWVLGKIAKFFGLVVASHLALLFADLASVLVFYLCSRRLGHRPLFAAGAALLYGFSHYNMSRGLGHYSLALSYTIPAILLVVWMIGGGRELLRQRRWQVFCMATAAATALGTPYYGIVFVVLLVLGMGYQAVTRVGRNNLDVGGTTLLVWGLVTAVSQWHAIEGMFAGGANVLVRTYADTEAFALRPLEWFVPPPHHRLPLAASMSREYGTLTLFEGEHYASYLGLVVIAGLALSVSAFLRALVQRRASLRPAHVAVIACVVAMGMVGGLNNLLALTVTAVFRAGNRYTVFVVVVVLYWLAGAASVRWRRATFARVAAFVAAVVGLGLWDQLRPVPGDAELAARAKAPAVDWNLGQQLERALPAGAMVFQIPVVPFLEQPAVGGMTDYEQFRPFLATTSLRFSYGHLANASALVWQRRVARLPAAEMRAELERAGFAAVHVHCLAFGDSGASLRQSFEATGMPLLFRDGPHMVFGLQPQAVPQLPELRGPNRLEPWDGQTANPTKASVLVGTGWAQPETSAGSLWRWGVRDATMVLWNPTATARRVRVRCSVMGAEKPLEIRDSGRREVWAGSLRPGGVPMDFEVEMAPGENALQWTYRGPLARQSPSDKRLLGFRVNDLSIEDLTK